MYEYVKILERIKGASGYGYSKRKNYENCGHIKGASGYGCSKRKAVNMENAKDFVGALEAHQDMDAVKERLRCGKCNRFCGRIKAHQDTDAVNERLYMWKMHKILWAHYRRTRI